MRSIITAAQTFCCKNTGSDQLANWMVELEILSAGLSAAWRGDMGWYFSRYRSRSIGGKPDIRRTSRDVC